MPRFDAVLGLIRTAGRPPNIMKDFASYSVLRFILTGGNHENVWYARLLSLQICDVEPTRRTNWVFEAEVNECVFLQFLSACTLHIKQNPSNCQYKTCLCWMISDGSMAVSFEWQAQAEEPSHNPKRSTRIDRNNRVSGVGRDERCY